MARPKLGDGETERLHVKISTEELTEIDDWRFASRISSRSEAVRRLCKLGIFVDNGLEAVVDMGIELRQSAARNEARLLKEARSISAKQRDGEPIDAAALAEFISESFEIAMSLHEEADHLSTHLLALFNSIVPLSDAKSFAEAKAEMDTYINDHNEYIAEMYRKWDERDENRIIAITTMSMSDQQRLDYEALTEAAKEDWWTETIARVREEEKLLANKEGDK